MEEVELEDELIIEVYLFNNVQDRVTRRSEGL